MSDQIGIRNHLRQFVEEKINKKIVLEKKLRNYREQENKYRERGIDQAALISNVENDIQNRRVEYLIERRNKDIALRTKVNEIIRELEADIEELTQEMVGHLEELSAIELSEGNFVAHRIGVGDNASFNRQSRFIYFFEGGRAEIPIGARLNRWDDVSQLRLIRKRGS